MINQTDVHLDIGHAVCLAEAFSILYNMHFVHFMLYSNVFDNRCYYIHHMSTVCVSNICTQIFMLCFVTNPLSRSSFFSGYFPFAPAAFSWFCGIFAFAFQSFAFYVLAFSRIVALTFRRNHLSEIWSPTVVTFAGVAQLGFPFLLASSFFLDKPGIHYNHVLQIEWQNKPLYIDFLFLNSVIHSISSFIIVFGLLLAIMKRISLTSWSRPSASASSIIVRTLAVENRTENEMSTTIPASFSSRETRYSALLVVFGVVEYLKTFKLRQGFPMPSEEDVCLSIFMSVLIPLGSYLYWLIPRLFQKAIYSSPCLRFRKPRVPAYTAYSVDSGISFEMPPQTSVAGASLEAIGGLENVSSAH